MAKSTGNIKIVVNLYEINKGNKSLPSYKAIVKRDVINKSKLNVGDGCLFQLNNCIFPSVIVKHNNSKGSYCYSFTIPREIAKDVKIRNIELDLLQLCKPSKIDHIKKIKNYIILPKFTKTRIGNPLYSLSLNKNDNIVWIYSRGCKPFVLPKKIQIRYKEIDLIEVIGAFFCEGLRSRKKGHNLDRLSFSNSEPEQISWFIKSIEKLFKIKKDAWDCQILFPKTSPNLINKLKCFWSKQGINKNNIKVYKNESVRAEHGVCIVSISNSSLAEVFYQIYEFCKNIICNNKQYALSFFRGVSRGDIGIVKNCITFSTREKEDAELYAKVCKLLNLSPSNLYYSSGCWNVNIFGYDNFKYLIENDAIKHTKRKNRLYKNFINSKKSILYKYLKNISKNINSSLSLAKILDLSQITTVCYLRKFKNQGYIKGTRKYKNDPYTYTLTLKGNNTLKFYSKIERSII